MELKDVAAVVTGGASGLGSATVAALSERGASVVAFDLPAAVEGVRPLDGVQFAAVDVTVPEQIATGLDVVAGTGKPLRLVVNCAGIGPSARILSRKGTHDLDLFAKVVQINLVGTFNVMTLAAERMAATEPVDEFGQRGVVVNTASVAGYEGQIGQAAYSSSKGGVLGLTLPAARDLAQYGIRVNTIAPGIVDTPMLATVAEEYRRALAEGVPFPRRLGRPEEYAQLVVFLAEHDYINGETIRMDGALRMAPK